MNNFGSKLRRFAYGCIFALLFVTAVYVAFRPRPVLVDTASVTEGPMQVTVDEDGITRIRERYIVSTPLTGRLLRVTLEVGDSVKADETIIARMEATDPALLDPRAMAQAQARVQAAEHRLAARKAELTRAEATVNFAEQEMGRLRTLKANDAASEKEFAEAELEFRQRTEETRAAGFAVDIAEYELELEQAALLLTDPDQSSETEMELAIKAPIAGRVLRINQESTTVVTAGSPLMEIGDPADLEIVVDVLSRDAVRIEPGDHVILEHWGGEYPLDGRVRLVEPSGFTKLSALGVEEQRVNIVVDLNGPADARKNLGDGFRVDCRIIVWQSDDALQLPTSALFRVDDDWHVFQVEAGLARLTKVEIGNNNGQHAEVISGIAAGSAVIVHPSDTIEDGVPVQQR